MTVKASGTPISFLDIVAEFGAGSLTNNTNNISLGSYRIAQQLDTIATSGVGGTFYPIADGMPLPGQQIKMGDFYSKTKTIIIQYGSSFRSTTGRSLSGDCGNRSNLVGTGFSVFQVSPSPNALSLTTPMADIGTAKVVVSIAGSLGSRTIARTNCALNIDSNFGNSLIVEIGPNATISGAGGAGGAGGARNSVGGAGFNGGSALGISTTGITSIFNRGRIQLGMGGGGGGAGGRNTGEIGGGGGGGAGYPVGPAGTTATGGLRPGFPGAISIGGTGGNASPSNTSATRSGIGGTGGSTEPLTNAGNGGNSVRNTTTLVAVGGTAGLNGYRMVVSPGITTPVIVPITYALIPSKQIGSDLTSTNPTL